LSIAVDTMATANFEAVIESPIRWIVQCDRPTANAIRVGRAFRQARINYVWRELSSTGRLHGRQCGYWCYFYASTQIQRMSRVFSLESHSPQPSYRY